MKRLLLVMLIVGLLITLFPPAAIASPPSQEPPPPECNPRAIFLADLMGEDVTCQDLMALQADGVGFGVIMKAYFLSQVFPDLDWEDLVERHMSEEGLGWGQIMKAYYLASLLGLDAEELLEKRAEGMGWGQILKEQGLEPGKPPWAGQGKPPWAGPKPWKSEGRCPPQSRSPRCAD